MSSGVGNNVGLSHGFKVSIASSQGSRGGAAVLFKSCDGIQSEIEVHFLNDGTAVDRAIPVRGRKLGGLINFTRGVADNTKSADDFFKWYQDVCDSSVVLKRKLLSISLLDVDQGNKEIARWEIKGAWPCRWIGPLLDTTNATPAIENLSFAYESIVKVA